MQQQVQSGQNIPVSILQTAEANRLGQVIAVVDNRKKPVNEALLAAWGGF